MKTHATKRVYWKGNRHVSYITTLCGSRTDEFHLNDKRPTCKHCQRMKRKGAQRWEMV